jgi:5-(carboxyamino)imidazole ribonucleotide synthase
MTSLAPGATIGILGGGQLGRMMAIAAAEMGYHAHIYCPEKNCPASEVAMHATTADYEDIAALTAFAKTVDVVTYEFENIPFAPVFEIAKHVPVFPSPEVLATAQHRVKEKTAVNALGIKTTPFMSISNNEEFHTAIKKIGLPAVLKTCTMGYDGKGQYKVKANPSDGELGLNSVLPSLPGQNIEYILEGFVDFNMEISVIVARDASGNIQSYCPVQNIHKHHILHETIAPAPIEQGLRDKAEAIAHTIAKGLNLVGLLAIEMFVCSNDDILINELAPRPHNSGHWTMDACITSQFTQTIRAICGLPLGSPERLCDAKMLNLIGDDVNDWQKYASLPNAKLHLYGKSECRTGRKMGHVNQLIFTK